MAHSGNYPDDWNTRNLRGKTIAFMNEIQATCDKYGLYITNAESDAGCGVIVDAKGLAVAVDVCLSEKNTYYGCYQELIGERPKDDDTED